MNVNWTLTQLLKGQTINIRQSSRYRHFCLLREKKRESSMCWFIPPMATMIRAGSEQCQEPRFPAWLPRWIQRSKHLDKAGSCVEIGASDWTGIYATCQCHSARLYPLHLNTGPREVLSHDQDTPITPLPFPTLPQTSISIQQSAIYQFMPLHHAFQLPCSSFSARTSQFPLLSLQISILTPHYVSVALSYNLRKVNPSCTQVHTYGRFNSNTWA